MKQRHIGTTTSPLKDTLINALHHTHFMASHTSLGVGTKHDMRNSTTPIHENKKPPVPSQALHLCSNQVEEMDADAKHVQGSLHITVHLEMSAKGCLSCQCNFEVIL
jgi:hypothetical protein